MFSATPASRHAHCDCVYHSVTAGHEVTIFFYNPNIHPREEYEIRKEENKRFAEKMGTPFVDADYDTEEWFRRARGMEFDPERGSRCTMCFDMRMERTACAVAQCPRPPQWGPLPPHDSHPARPITACMHSSTGSIASRRRTPPRAGRTCSR